MSKRKHKWTIDFATSGRGRGDKSVVPFIENLPAPVGFTDVTTFAEKAKESDSSLIIKRSWEIALGPLKQVPMNMFIMWMAGSSISIFPIMMIGMMFFRPIQAMMAIQNTFKSIEGEQAILQKLVYCIGNLVCLVMAVYKCQTMGLLPTHASDWLAFVEPQKFGVQSPVVRCDMVFFTDPISYKVDPDSPSGYQGFLRESKEIGMDWRRTLFVRSGGTSKSV